jgi:hypothetical protein
VRTVTGAFRSDRGGEPVLTDTQLRAQSGTTGQELTYTAVPVGSGVRIAIDRDGDGWYDADEIDAGTDPADPLSFPSSPTTTVFSTTTSTTLPLPANPVMIAPRTLTLTDDVKPPIDTRKRKITFRSYASAAISAPAPGSGGDPRVGGAVLQVYRADAPFGPEIVTTVLAASNWTLIGNSSGVGYRYRGPDPEGPIRTIVIAHDKLTLRGGRANWAYTLDEPYQAQVALRLVLGNTAGWCTSTYHNNNRSGRVLDYPGRFVGTPLITPPPTCLPPASPSGAFLDNLR